MLESYKLWMNKKIKIIAVYEIIYDTTVVFDLIFYFQKQPHDSNDATETTIMEIINVIYRIFQKIKKNKMKTYEIYVCII